MCAVVVGAAVGVCVVVGAGEVVVVAVVAAVGATVADGFVGSAFATL